MERLTIGKMARLNHVSEQTLRLYDKMGLLSPCNTGDENGYRYYDIRQSARLDMIQYMKSLGMGLKDIKAQLESKDIARLTSLLRMKSEQLDEQLLELAAQQRAIERTIESFARYESSPPDGTIVMEYIGKRYMYCIDSKTNFYDYGIEVYERILRELRSSLVSDRLPQIYFCNAGSILRKHNLLSRSFFSTEVFVFVDKEFVREGRTAEIPASTYLCIYCDQFDKEKEYISRLLDAVEERGCCVAGDYLCEAISDLPVPSGMERGMFLRLQVPISFR